MLGALHQAWGYRVGEDVAMIATCQSPGSSNVYISRSKLYTFSQGERDDVLTSNAALHLRHSTVRHVRKHPSGDPNDIRLRFKVSMAFADGAAQKQVWGKNEIARAWGFYDVAHWNAL